MKTIFGYYLANFCVNILFQANVLFLYESMEYRRENWPENIEIISIYTEDD